MGTGRARQTEDVITADLVTADGSAPSSFEAVATWGLLEGGAPIRAEFHCAARHDAAIALFHCEPGRRQSTTPRLTREVAMRKGFTPTLRVPSVEYRTDGKLEAWA
jgi:hypothetical protein